MGEKQVDEGIKEKIAKAVQQVVLQDQILEQKQQLEQQLIKAKQQLIFWDTKVKQLSGALANCSVLLAKAQKPKTLELESDNTKPEKK